MGTYLQRKSGKRLNLTEKALPRTDALLNLDLRCADFSGADLRQQNFGSSKVTDADFTDADLSDADLSLVLGLQASQLSGADLNRCNLPADVAAFPLLATVATLSQNAGTMFLTTILACIFVLLTAYTTGDIQLLTNSGTAELPVLKINVSTQLFFYVAPLVLLILSVTLHLYLQRLWETMAQLPAVFPDGATVDNKTYPWLVNDLIRTGFDMLKRPQYDAPLVWMQLKAFSLIAYGTVPLTLLLVFLRCLPRHDPFLSGWQTLMLALGMAWAYLVRYLSRITLRRLRKEREDFLKWRFPALWRPTLSFLVLLTFGSFLTFYAYDGTPLILSAAQEVQVKRWSNNNEIDESLQRIADAFTAIEKKKKSATGSTEIGNLDHLKKSLKESRVALLGLPAAFTRSTPFASWRRFPLLKQVFAGYEERPWVMPLLALSPGEIVEDTTQLTDKWKPVDTEFPSPLLPPDATLTKAQMTDEVAKETLKPREYHISETDQTKFEESVASWRTRLLPVVKRASFQGANLRFLHARGAFLVNADFRGADMTGADFTEADLRNALFTTHEDDRRLIRLSFATLNGAKLEGADLSGAQLSGAQLSGAHLLGVYFSDENHSYADLSGADLSGADLRFARLRFADLSGADLSGADLRYADLGGAILRYTHLLGVHLSGADLRGAHLLGAYFNSADLSGADLRYADLNGADLSGAIYCDQNRPIWKKGAIPQGWRERLIGPRDSSGNGVKDWVELIPTP